MSPLRGLIKLEKIKAYKHFTATRLLMLDFDKFNPDRGDMLIGNASKNRSQPHRGDI